NPHVPSRQNAEIFPGRDTDGVRLLSAGAARAPDSQTPAIAPQRPLADLREEIFTQEIEVVALAKKIGLVGGDAVDHLEPLRAVGIGAHQVVVIFAEARETEVAQPPGETRA